MQQPAITTQAELDTPNPAGIVPDAEGYLYDCAFRQHVSRRLNAAQVEHAEAVKAVAMAGKQINRAFEVNLARVGLSLSQFRLLMGVRYAGPDGIHMHRVAEWMGVTARNVTALVDSLEASGLVARVADPADRRAFKLQLTPAGEERSVAALRLNDADQRRVLGALTMEERKQLRHLCLKLVQAAMAPAPVKEVRR